MVAISKPRFPLGKVVATPAALEAIGNAGQEPGEFLRRHVLGDWGECDPGDAQANEDAVAAGDRILSVYRTRAGVRIWVITEADRSSTTVLLPEEY
jgi:hypothetical protein